MGLAHAAGTEQRRFVGLAGPVALVPLYLFDFMLDFLAHVPRQVRNRPDRG
jgi:hypothetical protein